MGVECAYSFSDLYRAAFGAEPSRQAVAAFAGLALADRNRTVRQWAEKAGWEVKDALGSDGQTYAAFAPSFGAAAIDGLEKNC